MPGALRRRPRAGPDPVRRRRRRRAVVMSARHRSRTREPAPEGPRGRARSRITGTRWSTSARSAAGQVVATKFWGDAHRALPRRRRPAARARGPMRAPAAPAVARRGHGCSLTCAYHGWSYERGRRPRGIPHDRCGRPMPSLRIRAYPVQVRYGLIWLFPGDPASRRTGGCRRCRSWRALTRGPTCRTASPGGRTTRWSSTISATSPMPTCTGASRRSSPVACSPSEARARPGADALRGEGRTARAARARPRPASLRSATSIRITGRASSGRGSRGASRTGRFSCRSTLATTRVFFMFCYDTLRVPWLPFRSAIGALTWLLRLGNAGRQAAARAGRFRAGGRAAWVRSPSGRARDRAESRGGPPPPPDGPQVGRSISEPRAARVPRGGGDVSGAAGAPGAARPTRAAPGRRPAPRLLVRGGVRPRDQARPGRGGGLLGAVHRALPRQRRRACARSRIAARTVSSSSRSATVSGCALTCAYHGWSYAEDGRLAANPPRALRPTRSRRCVCAPIRSRCATASIWLFPGDPGARRAARASPTSRSWRDRSGGRACPSTSAGGRTTR